MVRQKQQEIESSKRLAFDLFIYDTKISIAVEPLSLCLLQIFSLKAFLTLKVG